MEKAKKLLGGPIVVRNGSMADNKEVYSHSSFTPVNSQKLAMIDWLIDQIVKFISDLGISKVQLRAEDIDMIMDTLISDGKAERCEVKQNKIFLSICFV